eukprot:scaffold23479_cov143-Cylindrotheca_fusiformis.AAC.12
MSEPILRAYGQVSSDNSSAEVTTDTAFMVASVSKLFAGSAVLKLVDQGVISLDDDICDVLPVDYDYTACRNPLWPDTKVTWRMLVTHRSSLIENIPEVNGMLANYGPTGGYLEGLAGGNPSCPLTDVTGFYRDIMIDKETETTVGSDLDFNWYALANKTGGVWEDYEPGTRTLYTNFGIGYIAALVEYATSMSFPEYCQEHIFAPLKMKNTAWFRESLPSGVQTAVPVSFVGNASDVDNTTATPESLYEDIGHYCYIDYASGSLYTTAADISLFLRSMLDYGAPTLWPVALGKTAVECAEPDTSSSECEYGVAWSLLKKLFAGEWLQESAARLDWTDAAGHNGAEAGIQTQVVMFPKSGVYAAVLTNTNGNDENASEDLVDYLMYYANELVNPSADDDGGKDSSAPESRSGALALLLLCLTAQILLASLQN